MAGFPSLTELQSSRLDLPSDTPYQQDGITQFVIEDPERFRDDHGALASLPQLPALIGFVPRYNLTLNDTLLSRARDWHNDHHPSSHDRVPPTEITIMIAFGDCPEGTLEWAPSSHRWPVVEQETLLERFGGWQREAEAALGVAVRDYLVRFGISTCRPAIPAGTCLVWHPWLWHRSDEGLERDALVVRCQP